MNGRFIKKKVKGLEEDRFYCESCGHLLAKGAMKTGSWIEFKCRACNQINRFEYLTPAA
uniref:Uncharacterized protein n=1 Tax=viral metagenome TaxID=1070528 RepID=A0A6M3KT97_9ZZZZ